MVRSILFCLAACAITIAAGCMANNSASIDEAENRRCEDCAQPPLLRSELVDHLKEHQERILARDDYRHDVPGPVSNVIYGPLPDEPWRDGPEIVDHDGEHYRGALNWHYIAFDEVNTDGTEHRSIRGRHVSGAHCFFAHQPNQYTAIFSVLVLHHRDRGDVLYQGGPRHRVNRIDTVPMTDRHRGRIRVDTDHLWCAFRGDQNRLGALVIPFRYMNRHNSEGSRRYAVFTAITAERPVSTGQATQIEVPAGARSRETDTKTVPVKEYPDPRIDFVDVFDSPYEALRAAEEVIPPGRFRLRPVLVYPRMAYQSYLNDGEPQFCPVRTECVEPREHFDADIVPPLPTRNEEDGDPSAENSGDDE